MPQVSPPTEKRKGRPRHQPELAHVRVNAKKIAPGSMPKSKGFMEQDQIAERALTTSQKEFVRFMGQGETVFSASKKADINPTYAYALMKRPYVAKLVDAERLRYEEAAQMDRKQVMEGFKEAIEMAKLMSEPANMIAGWREIGKMCGYYAPVETKLKIDVTGNVTMTRLTQMSDAELLELIEKGAKAAEPELLTDQTDGQG